MTDRFVNLHNHFDYSVLDGAMRISAGVTRAVELGQTHLAMTDHGTLGGSFAFYKECLAQSITPIIGIEAYVAPESAGTKEPVFWATPDQRREDVGGAGKYLHLTLLARTGVGLQNLFKLQHLAYANGFYGKPRMDRESLAANSDGITVLTGCVGGPVATALKLGQTARAYEWLDFFKEVYGEHAYVEFMDHDIEVEKRIRQQLVDLAHKCNIPMVATSDAHYALAKDSDVHDTLLCIQTRTKKADETRFRFEGAGYHLASREEMAHNFSSEFLDNTLWIAEYVESYDWVFKRQTRFPQYQGESNPGHILESKLFEHEWSEEYNERIQFELDTIIPSGYAGYFLVLADVMALGRSMGIRFGPGRGSAGGSLVAFLLGITEIDPIRNGLLFERFLNPERVSIPDIDIDIDDTRRDEFIAAVAAKYGVNNVAQIGTYGTIKARAAIKDAARVLGYPVKTAIELTNLLPPARFGRSPKLNELPKLARPKEIVDAATNLEDTIRSVGVHASGVVIAPGDLTGILPTRNPAGKGNLTLEYTGAELEELGFAKYDFLGLATLGVIDECMSLLQGSTKLGLGSGFELPNTYDDPKVFEMLRQGKTTGVFQLESPGMRGLLRSVSPTSIDDIIAVLALYRPGPMGANAHKEYADRKNGRAQIRLPHPDFTQSEMATILQSTYGLIVYQEQVLKILASVGGYTYSSAALIFDAMRKKQTDKMLAARPDFMERVQGNGFSYSAAEALWETLVPFSDYSFNRSHSYGYGVLSYYTAWLKANYPVEFYASLLSRESKPEKVIEYIKEALNDDVRILPPDINESNLGWTVVESGIRFGLKSVKGLSVNAYKALTAARPYSNLTDFLSRVSDKALNGAVMKAAIQAGALDTLETSREGLLESLDHIIGQEQAAREQAGKGMTKLWRGYAYQKLPENAKVRQRWEKEVLGVALTKPKILVKVKRLLNAEEFEYLRRVSQTHAGDQAMTLVFGKLTKLANVARVNVNERFISAIEALGLEIEEQ